MSLPGHDEQNDQISSVIFIGEEMSDTPRTDEQWQTSLAGKWLVSAEFARTLERELAEALQYQADAQRYRWLRDNRVIKLDYGTPNPRNLDQMIDAALREEESQ